MREPIEIFGLKIRPLTLSQVEQLEKIVLKKPGQDETNTTIAREVIKIALMRDHAGIDPMQDIECDYPSIAQAMSAILELGGFVTQGEALAAAPNAPIGELSEAG